MYVKKQETCIQKTIKKKTDESNQRWHKEMEKCIMVLDWKNQHSENDSTTQSNLKIHHNPDQTTKGIFHTTRTNNFSVCMETLKTPITQSNLDKQEWNWKSQPSWLQTILKTILQSYSHQNSMAERQKYRSMEQNREPRDKCTHLCTCYLWQRRHKYTVV